MKLSEARAEKYLGVFFIIFGAAVALIIPHQVSGMNAHWTNSPRLLPFIIAGLIVLLGACLVFSGVNKQRRVREEDQETYSLNFEQFKMVASIVVLLSVYVILLPIIGYIPSTMLMLAVMMLVCGQKSILKIAIVSIALTLLVYYSFTYILMLKMP